jgi:periplasmic protein TonB
MGILTAPKREIAEVEGRIGEGRGPENQNQFDFRGETEAGVVEHNGTIGVAAGIPRLVRPVTREPAATMANETLTISSAESEAAAAYVAKHEFDGLLGKSFEDKPIWSGLYESIRDVFFPPKLPPLQLTSTPVAVPDRMKVKANPVAIGVSTGVNGAILAALLIFGVTKVVTAIQKKETSTPIDVGVFKVQAPKGPQAGGGGGGGSHDIVDPEKGRMPQKVLKAQVTPPQVQTVDKPKLAIEPTVNVQPEVKLPDNPLMPNLGVFKSPNVTIASNGQGSGAGIGTGSGTGIGSGNGNGVGPGSGGNFGGGVYQVGGGITAPVPLNNVEAEFSDEARRAKYQGVCLISLIVDANGNPQNPRVMRPLGMGLDEKALEAVRKYRFKPAHKKDGTAVPVMISVEVNFRLY